MPVRERPSHKATANDHEYDGWKNYPTWVVHAWLTNTEDVYYEARDRLGGAVDALRGADELKEWIEGESPLEDASIYTSLLGWALQAIDWDEIARALGPDEWGVPKAPTVSNT